MARLAERDLAAAIVPALAARSYHIPGNTWWQDWGQYFSNNHPILGLCCHHKFHPVGTGKRVVVLVGSMACGLAVSNIIYLWFLTRSDDGVDGEFAVIGVAANFTVADSGSLSMDRVVFTNYQITLWTVGTFIHCMFDLSVWFIAACGCCQPGGSLEYLQNWRWLGSYIMMFTVVVTAATASFIVILRATLDSHPEYDTENITSGGLFDDAIQLGDTDSPASYQFLVSWLIEMVLALFVYYFVVGTILFSGILGCYTLPFLGGRPREVKLEEKEAEKRRRRRNGDGYSDEESPPLRTSVLPLRR